jgi:hypothetical protein
MAVTIDGTIQVRDNQGQAHTIDGDDFNLQDPEVEERAQGPEMLYEATYENDDANFSISVLISEYPVDAHNFHDVHVYDCTVIQNQLQVSVQPDDREPD